VREKDSNHRVRGLVHAVPRDSAAELLGAAVETESPRSGTRSIVHGTGYDAFQVRAFRSDSVVVSNLSGTASTGSRSARGMRREMSEQTRWNVRSSRSTPSAPIPWACRRSVRTTAHGGSIGSCTGPSRPIYYEVYLGGGWTSGKV
jgi:hypothetical protein